MIPLVERGEDRPATRDVLDLGVLDLGVLDDAGDASDASDADDEGADRRPAGRVSRRRLLAAGAGLATSGALGVIAARAASPRSPPAGAPLPNPPTPDASPVPPYAHYARQVTVLNTGQRLPDTSPGWDVFALGLNRLVRIHPASGRVTLTALPAPADGQVALVPARHRAFVQPADYRKGCVVPDDRPAGDLPVALSGSGLLLPGPDQDHVWVPADNLPHPTLALLTVDGAWAGLVAPAPPYAIRGPFPDGEGYLLYECVGGVYRIGHGLPRRVSTGTLVAVGAPGWLVIECDDVAACRVVLRTPDGGTTAVPARIGVLERRGVLSPDGARVALSVPGPVGTVGLVLLDLRSGLQKDVGLALAGTDAGGALAWSPDGRRLLAVDVWGQIQAVDPTTGRTSLLMPHLPAVVRLAVRAA